MSASRKARPGAVINIRVFYSPPANVAHWMIPLLGIPFFSPYFFSIQTRFIETSKLNQFVLRYLVKKN